MSTPEEIADLCDKAADIIAANGWVQGRLWPGARDDVDLEASEEEWRPGLPVCAYGAMWAARGGDDSLILSAIDAMGLGGSLATWNDQPGRTADDVIERFRQTAKGLRETGGPA